MRRILAFAFSAAVCAALASGCAQKSSSTGSTSSLSTGAATADAPLRVAITIDSTGFNPPEVKAIAGKPVTLVFTRITDQTCATSVVIPSLKITKDVPLNTPTEITFTPGKHGDIDFACGMNMISGVVVVQ